MSHPQPFKENLQGSTLISPSSPFGVEGTRELRTLKDLQGPQPSSFTPSLCVSRQYPEAFSTWEYAVHASLGIRSLLSSLSSIEISQLHP